MFSSGLGSWVLASLALALLALACTVLLFIRQRRIARQFRHWMTGTSGGSLEEILTEHVLRVRETGERVDSLAEQTRLLEETGRLSLQHAAIVRYNPFRDTGSDQSFALALADSRGNGVVLSSLHARDGTRVYGKALTAWESAHALTDEEKSAIARARGDVLKP
ncbi:MAG TPA: DUF4446 family protein [Anaerolineae bacterium]|nr:DUF4446 family protein [Anaerolineae bacterium]HNS50488.1 DUF4446 family protein [Anaerolineae bacterium]